MEEIVVRTGKDKFIASMREYNELRIHYVGDPEGYWEDYGKIESLTEENVLAAMMLGFLVDYDGVTYRVKGEGFNVEVFTPDGEPFVKTSWWTTIDKYGAVELIEETLEDREDQSSR